MPLPEFHLKNLFIENENNETVAFVVTIIPVPQGDSDKYYSPSAITNTFPPVDFITGLATALEVDIPEAVRIANVFRDTFIDLGVSVLPPEE